MGGLFGLDGVGLVLFFSFSFLFNPLLQKIFSSFQKKLLNHTTKQKPMHST
jgi:hypothetical protein